VNHTLAPARLLRGPGVLGDLGAEVARLGRRPLLVHGAVGYGKAQRAIDLALHGSGLNMVLAHHDGHVTPSAIAALRSAAVAAECDVVTGVGGGRVLDAAKAAAEAAGLPFVAVPTSPATCAAMTSLTVSYDAAGVWAGPIAMVSCPDAVVLDHAVLAAAPDRLLAAGVLDALVKVREVRLAARRATALDTLLRAALALCDELAALVDPQAGVLANGLPTAPSDRSALAEAVVVLPGLIAGLGGEGNKLAGAHAVHNALTLLPGHDRSLHGELVAVGLLLQDALDGAGDVTLTRTITWMRGLGIDPSLTALGCRDVLDDPTAVLERMYAAPSLRRAFPEVSRAMLWQTLQRVDGLAVAAAGRQPDETPHPLPH